MSAGGVIFAPPRGRRKALRALGYLMLSGVVVIATLVGAIVFGARHVAHVSASRTFDIDDVPEQAIAMVLGAKADPGRPSAFLAARLDLAVELYELGKIEAVLVSGDNLAGSNFETSVMRDYLVGKGVPADRIVEDPAGYDTYDSCVRARDVFGVTEMVVLTQLYHLERALTICVDIGIDAVGVGDVTARDRFPALYSKGEAREWAANLKMEWDLISRRKPQQDPFDGSLLRAAGL